DYANDDEPQEEHAVIILAEQARRDEDGGEGDKDVHAPKQERDDTAVGDGHGSDGTWARDKKRKTRDEGRNDRVGRGQPGRRARRAKRKGAHAGAPSRRDVVGPSVSC